MNAIEMVEIWRGPIAESIHRGHAVVSTADGTILHGWGNPEEIILPRSSVKMIQALPLVTSGAADSAGLGPEQLALACASHNGAAIHTEPVQDWLTTLNLGESDLRCGIQTPSDPEAKRACLCTEAQPCQLHNNCSGKHAGFLTLNQYLRGDAEYIDPEHPVQRAARDAFEEVTQTDSPFFGIDGCSAPNFATRLDGLARAMAWFSTAADRNDSASRAAQRLSTAMRAHPHLVAGEGRACTELMRAANGKVVIKTGAEGVFTAILPTRGLGVALKITDGATRASECAITAILVALGALDPEHPDVKKRLNPEIKNWRGMVTGEIKPTAFTLE